MRLIVIRHGQSVINVTEDYWNLDTVDTELTEVGHRQAAALRDWLRDHNVTADAFYASTLVRTRQTAEYVAEALGMEPTYEDRIREVGNNYTSGLPIATEDLPSRFAGSPGYAAPFLARAEKPELVESWMHFRARFGGFLEDMIERHLNETVYLVAHDGVVSVLFEHLFNTGPRRFLTIHTENTGWSEVEYRRVDQRDGIWSLIHHNRIEHLSELNEK